MKNKHIQCFNEHQENLNISDVSDSTGEYVDIEGHKVWVDYEPRDTKEILYVKAKRLYYRWLRSEISSLDKDREYYR